MLGDYDFYIILDEQNQRIIDAIEQTQGELIAAVSETQAEHLEALHGIQDALSGIHLALGFIVGAALVLICSHGMRNAT